MLVSAVAFASKSNESDLQDASIIWGRSSAGRAPDLHSGGQEFDPPRLHHSSLLFIQIPYTIRSLSTGQCLAVQSDACDFGRFDIV